MKKSPLLDSNIIIDCCNGKEEARKYLKQFDVLRIPAVSVFEVLAGCTGSRESQREIASVIFEVSEIVPFGAVAAEHAATVFTKTKNKGRILDYFIAGTAKEYDLVLSTRNPRDFRAVKTVEPYKTE